MLHIQDSPYIRNIHYENAKDFIRAISYDGKLYELFNEHHIFRGHKPAMIRESDGKPNIKPKTDRRSLDVQLHEYLSDINAPARHYLYQITIPQDAAYTIYSHIEHLGYNASTLFPGYDGVVRFLDEHLRIHKDS